MAVGEDRLAASLESCTLTGRLENGFHVWLGEAMWNSRLLLRTPSWAAGKPREDPGLGYAS